VNPASGRSAGVAGRGSARLGAGAFAEVMVLAGAVGGASFPALRRNDGMADRSELRVGSGTGIAGRG
jgi:hypothetical protein